MREIKLDNVQVNFPIYELSNRSLKNTLLNVGGGIVTEKHRNKVTVIEALKNINLHFEDGDRVGLIGHNGAGKSTLLRVLAGVYMPVAGAVSISGKVTPLLDINLGVNEELTGFDNIYMRGMFLGYSKKEIAAKIADIEEFSELGEYLGVPLRAYSEGMKLRLAFSIATAFTAEILLADETIMAGDAHFINKIYARVREFVQSSSIFVLASHAEDLVREFCNKAVLLEHGEVKYVGNVDVAFDMYSKLRA